MEQLKLLPRGLYSPTSFQRFEGLSVASVAPSLSVTLRQHSRAPPPLLSLFSTSGRLGGLSECISPLFKQSFGNVGSREGLACAAKAQVLLPPPMVYQPKEQEPLSEVHAPSNPRTFFSVDSANVALFSQWHCCKQAMALLYATDIVFEMPSIAPCSCRFAFANLKLHASLHLRRR